MRAHGLARGMQDAGLEVVCLNRPGFPLDLKRELTAAAVPLRDTVDGIDYRRIAAPLRSNADLAGYMLAAADALEAELRRLAPRMGGRRLQLHDRPAGADRRAAAGPAVSLRGARLLGSDAAVARAGVRAERRLQDPGAAGGGGRQARRSCLHPHRTDARRAGPARRGSGDHHAPAQFLRPRALRAARPRRGARRPPRDPGVGAGDRLHRHLRPVRGARGSGRRRRHAARPRPGLPPAADRQREHLRHGEGAGHGGDRAHRRGDRPRRTG